MVFFVCRRMVNLPVNVSSESHEEVIDAPLGAVGRTAFPIAEF
jgi:hypothetical protein